MSAEVTIPRSVMHAYGLEGATVETISIGLINRTFQVALGPQKLILQRLHPIFDASVNRDIDAVTSHLEAAGLTTPRPVCTEQGALWVGAEDGVWRALSFLPGRVSHTVAGPDMAREAGGLVARFHHALSDLEHQFHFTRPGAHDTPRHLAHLEEALLSHGKHPAIDAVQPVAAAILEHAPDLPHIGELPRRIIHGDLKFSNVLFDEALERAVALIDLDTLAHGTVAVDVGDALRSWCNPAGEDDPNARFDQAVFEAAVSGYATGAQGLLSEGEVESIAPGLETISLELASRFCADALEERYFGWDEARFASRGAHNLVRARSQLSLAGAVRAARSALRDIVGQAFA